MTDHTTSSKNSRSMRQAATDAENERSPRKRQPPASVPPPPRTVESVQDPMRPNEIRVLCSLSIQSRESENLEERGRNLAPILSPERNRENRPMSKLYEISPNFCAYSRYEKSRPRRLSLAFKIAGGGRGIQTPEALRLAGFQDQRPVHSTSLPSLQKKSRDIIHDFTDVCRTKFSSPGISVD